MVDKSYCFLQIPELAVIGDRDIGLQLSLCGLDLVPGPSEDFGSGKIGVYKRSFDPGFERSVDEDDHVKPVFKSRFENQSRLYDDKRLSLVRREDPDPLLQVLEDWGMNNRIEFLKFLRMPEYDGGEASPIEPATGVKNIRAEPF